MGRLARSLALLAASYTAAANSNYESQQILEAIEHTVGDCHASTFADALPANAVIQAIEAVAEHGSYGEGAANLAYPYVPADLPALCAVTVNVTSSETSSYRFAVLLPTAWNGRFLSVGNAGFGGGINWADAAIGARYGFAATSTDTGHNSSIGDGSWALNQPEARADWGWRAIHGTAVLGKAMAAAYYGQPARFAYYAGCSTGGRQGVREAQLHPSTFDGLLVGAPAWWTAHLQTWTTWIGARNLPADAPHHIDAALFGLVGAEVLRQCDGADGLVDGIISAPGDCVLDFRALACGTVDNVGANANANANANASDCLTPPQIETLRAVYAPYVVDGQLAMPGLNMGSEYEFTVLLGGNDGEPNPLGTGYERFFLLDDAAWPWQAYNDSFVALADRLDPGSATAYGFDMLAAVRAHGAKILMYHGEADAYIPTGSSMYLYEQVTAATGDGDAAALHDWFRFFLVPGMGHCVGTGVDAPWYFAGANQAPAVSEHDTSLHSVPGFADPQHDALLALMAWVENGTAVDSIVATTWKDAMDPSSGVLRQRPLCPYPAKAAWDGVGDVNEAASWACK